MSKVILDYGGALDYGVPAGTYYSSPSGEIAALTAKLEAAEKERDEWKAQFYVDIDPQAQATIAKQAAQIVNLEHWIEVMNGAGQEQSNRIEALEKDAARYRGQEWQPIETAPKGANGYAWMLLAWGKGEERNAGSGMRCGDKFFAAPTFYCFGQEKQYELREHEVHPTHWAPNPALPIAAAGVKS